MQLFKSCTSVNWCVYTNYVCVSFCEKDMHMLTGCAPVNAWASANGVHICINDAHLRRGPRTCVRDLTPVNGISRM